MSDNVIAALINLTGSHCLENVRLEAVRSLARFASDPEAQRRLIELTGSNTLESVRLEAIQALAGQALRPSSPKPQLPCQVEISKQVSVGVNDRIAEVVTTRFLDAVKNSRPDISWYIDIVLANVASANLSKIEVSFKSLVEHVVRSWKQPAEDVSSALTKCIKMGLIAELRDAKTRRKFLKIETQNHELRKIFPFLEDSEYPINELLERLCAFHGWDFPKCYECPHD